MAISRVLAILILQYSLVALVSSAGPRGGWKTLQGVFLIPLPFSLLMFPMNLWSSFIFLLDCFVWLLRLMVGGIEYLIFFLEFETVVLTNYLLYEPFSLIYVSSVSAIITAMNSHQFFYLKKEKKKEVNHVIISNQE